MRLITVYFMALIRNEGWSCKLSFFSSEQDEALERLRIDNSNNDNKILWFKPGSLLPV